MPQSKKRHHSHSQPQQHHTVVKEPVVKKFNKVVKVIIIFFAAIGFFVSMFITGLDVLSQLVGTILGGICGYFFGQQMNKTFYKK